jgi:hypothetical protein
VIRLFNNASRRKHSHGHRTCNKPMQRDVSFHSLLNYVNMPLGPYHICTKLYSALLKILYDLHDKAKASSYLDSSTPEYRLVYMIMDVAHHGLFG